MNLPSDVENPKWAAAETDTRSWCSDDRQGLVWWNLNRRLPDGSVECRLIVGCLFAICCLVVVFGYQCDGESATLQATHSTVMLDRPALVVRVVCDDDATVVSLPSEFGYFRQSKVCLFFLPRSVRCFSHGHPIVNPFVFSLCCHSQFVVHDSRFTITNCTDHKGERVGASESQERQRQTDMRAARDACGSV